MSGRPSRSVRFFVSLAVVAVALTVASGEARAEGWEVAPFVGFRFGGSVEEINSARQLDFDGAPAWGVSFGRAIGHEARVEGIWSHQSTSIGEFDLGVDIDYLHVAGVYDPQRDKKIAGFVLASAGVAILAPEFDGDSATRFSASVGGGGKFALNERLAIRLDARVWAVFTSSSAAVFCSGGCIFAFSSSAILQLETTAGLVIGF